MAGAEEPMRAVCSMLVSLSSVDNGTRQPAECQYQAILADGTTSAALAVSLASFVGNRVHPDEAMRQLAATLLCQVLGKNKYKTKTWSLLVPEQKQVITQMLMQSTAKELSRPVMRKVCDCISYLGSKLIPQNGWPELLPFLFQCTKSPESTTRCAALNIFADLALLLGDDSFAQFQSYVGTILSDGLKDGDLQVRLEALTACSTFLHLLDNANEACNFSYLLPLMLECIRMALVNSHPEHARNALSVFVELNEIVPEFFVSHFLQVSQTMMGIASTTQLEDDTRQLALVHLTTFCETSKSTVRNQPVFLQEFVAVLMSWLVECEDDPLWYQFESVENESTSFAEEMIDRVCVALGGKILMTPLFTKINEFLSNPNWKYRHAGLITVASSVAGFSSALKEHLEKILQLVGKFCADSHPRVRWAACLAMAQLCDGFSGYIENKYHTLIIPILLPCLTDTVLRVRGQCAVALKKTCENARRKIICPYINNILTNLTSNLSSNCLKLLEVIVPLLSAVATCVKADFANYYDSFAPFLKSVISTAKTKEFRQLRALAMECLTKMGIAVGKEKFSRDAIGIMQEIMSSPVEFDDPQVNYMQDAFSRIAECLGRDFAPYLPLVMPSVLARATISADVSFTGGTTDDMGWEVFQYGEKEQGPHTSLLEDKGTALHVLLEYTTSLGEVFFPYIEQVAQIFSSHMTFYYSDSIRFEASSSPPFIVKCILKHLKVSGTQDKPVLFKVWHLLFDSLVKAARDEPDRSTLAAQLSSIKECLEYIKEPSLTARQIEDFVGAASGILKESRIACSDLTQEADSDDECPDDEELISEHSVLQNVCDALGFLSAHHAREYSPFFHTHILPQAQQMMAPTQEWFEQQQGMCLLIDIIEHSTVMGLPLLGIAMDPLLSFAKSPNANLRQTAFYGLGICGKNGWPEFTAYLANSLRILHASIKDPKSRIDEEASCATDNAISAIARICEGHGIITTQAVFSFPFFTLMLAPQIPLNEVLPFWLECLPLSSDEEESDYCTGRLCHYIETTNEFVVGANMESLHKAVHTLTESLSQGTMSSQTAEYAASVINKLAHQQTTRPVPPTVLQHIWASLPENCRAVVQALLIP
ncbi:ARM family protein [Pelomyxa schiedti]|nr:ARM family protein [Pelomyxa schiedti]